MRAEVWRQTQASVEVINKALIHFSELFRICMPGPSRFYICQFRDNDVVCLVIRLFKGFVYPSFKGCCMPLTEFLGVPPPPPIALTTKYIRVPDKPVFQITQNRSRKISKTISFDFPGVGTGEELVLKL